MEGAINYILTLTYDGEPKVVVEPDIKKVWKILLDGAGPGSVFGLIDMQRMVVSYGDLVTYTRVFADWDDAGIIITDKYNNTVESYYPQPESEPEQEINFTYWERWEITKTRKIRCGTDPDKFISKMLEDGELDPVMDGWLEDTGYTYEIK